MNKKVNTRRALLTSVVSMLLCITMLIGSTFAWFTDNATTNVNKIESGTLKIDLVDAEGNSLVGKSLSFKTAQGENKLWEPGSTWELQDMKIVNKGSLALKYKILITGINGDAKLNEAIEWTINHNDTKLDLNTEFKLQPNSDSDTLTIEGHMKEAAGNEYQGLSIDGITITVMATQDTVEYDSNNNTYDAGATYDNVVVANSQADVNNAIEEAEQATVVVLTSDVALTDGVDIPAGKTVTLDLNGHTLSYASSETTGNAAITNRGNLTINDSVGTGKVTYVSSAPSTSYAYSTNTITNSGTLTVNNVTIENTTNGGSSNAIDNNNSGNDASLTVNGGTITSNNNITIRQFANNTSKRNVANIKDATISGKRGVQIHVATSGSSADLNISGGTINATDYSVLTILGGNTFKEININIAENVTLAGATYYSDGITLNGTVYQSE